MSTPVAQWIEHRSSEAEPKPPSDSVQDGLELLPDYPSHDRLRLVTAGTVRGKRHRKRQCRKGMPIAIPPFLIAPFARSVTTSYGGLDKVGLARYV